jgi:GWxTD domain-containing protein
MRLFICGLLLFGLYGIPLCAQNDSLYIRQGQEAFRAKDWVAAERAFRQALSINEQNAEVHYQLARVYWEMGNRRAAGRELDRALELDPDNVRYLVARLEHLRQETSFALWDLINEARRRELARRILRLDPENAFALEALGESYANDYWRYRDAVSLTETTFYDFPFRQEDNPDNNPFRRLDETVGGEQTRPSDEAPGPGGVEVERGLSFLEAFGVQGEQVALLSQRLLRAAFLEDPFDLELLRQQGEPVSDWSARGERAYRMARQFLERALDRDPMRRGAYEKLFRIYMLRNELAPAYALLRQMYEFFPEDPSTWLYLGLLHYRARRYDEADKAFQTAFHYDSTLKAIFEDVSALVPESERKAYEADPQGYSARFWASKKPRLLVPYNERKLEHFARMVYADLLFRVEALGLRGWQTERGRILIRYGIPPRSIKLLPWMVASGESLNLSEQMRTFDIWDYGRFRFVFVDEMRNGNFILYAPPASHKNPWMVDYVIKARETFRQLPEYYRFEPPGRLFRMPYLISTFRGREGKTDMVVPYGVPITNPDALGRSVLVAQQGLFLVDAGRTIRAERRNTLYGLRPERVVRFRKAALWIDAEQLSVEPGRYRLSLEFEESTTHALALEQSELVVPDYTGSRFAMSDLLLAYQVEEAEAPRAGEPVLWRNGFRLQPAPWAVFSRTQPVYVYFELYNLSLQNGRSAFEVEAIVRPRHQARGVARLWRAVAGSPRGVSVRARFSGTGPDLMRYLQIDVSRLDPGWYTLTLRVRDLHSRHVEQAERPLYLEE